MDTCNTSLSRSRVHFAQQWKKTNPKVKRKKTRKNKIMNRITHHKQMFSQFGLMNRVQFEYNIYVLDERVWKSFLQTFCAWNE